MHPANLARAGTLLLFASLQASAMAQSSGGNFSVIGHAIGGTGVSSGDSFSVLGSIGSGNAVSSGGSFSVNRGSAEIFTLPVGNFDLEILLSGGSYQISWPAEAFGYVLERSPSIGTSATWQTVTPAPGGNSYTATPTQSPSFFRLHRL